MQKIEIMGILNATPDSFYDGGLYASTESAVAYGKKLFQEGADIIDIGGESTRPRTVYHSTPPVDEEEEKLRVIPIIQQLKREVSVPLSIDTMKPSVAAAALAAGASIINDVSGFCHPAMQEIAASSGARLCVTHMLGNPQNMQVEPQYPGGIISTLLRFFEQRIEELFSKGVREEQIIVDPGIGFGKTIQHNFEIINNIQQFKSLGFPVLLGVSRKSFLQKFLNKTASELLSATLIVNTIGILSGVDIIRVHDVSEHRQATALVSAAKVAS